MTAPDPRVHCTSDAPCDAVPGAYASFDVDGPDLSGAKVLGIVLINVLAVLLIAVGVYGLLS